MKYKYRFCRLKDGSVLQRSRLEIVVVYCCITQGLQPFQFYPVVDAAEGEEQDG